MCRTNLALITKILHSYSLFYIWSWYIYEVNTNYKMYLLLSQVWNKIIADNQCNLGNWEESKFIHIRVNEGGCYVNALLWAYNYFVLIWFSLFSLWGTVASVLALGVKGPPARICTGQKKNIYFLIMLHVLFTWAMNFTHICSTRLRLIKWVPA